MITVIIPTNRINCIKLFIDKCIIPYTGDFFKFEIHDSSENSEIEQFFYNKRDSGLKNTSYYKYNILISADDKAIEAIKAVNDKYFWLMGDGNLVDFNEMELLLEGEITNYDILNLDTDNRIGYLNQDVESVKNHIYSIKNPVQYAQKYFSRLTFWGAAIINTDFYECIFANGLLNKYIDNKIPWWIACSIFEAINYYKDKRIVSRLGTIYTNYMSYNPAKKDHWWVNNERYYIYVFVKFNLGISLLPIMYSDSKKSIIRFFRLDALVKTTYLLHLRSKGVIKRSFVKKYKNDIINVDGFYYKMLLFCFIPRKIATLLYAFKPIVKYLCRIVNCDFLL